MKKSLMFALLVGTGACLAAIVMIWVSVPFFSEPYQTSMFVNAVIGSYAIRSPVAFYCMQQSERLKAAGVELDEVHQKLQEAHNALSAKIRIDAMTGFLNREHFLNELGKSRDKQVTGSLLIIDADHFKTVNDRFGHLSGDDALVLITRAIQQALRSEDLVGRIGGEEFGVFLPGASYEQAERIAERIRINVENIIFVPRGGELALPLTVSIGGILAAGPKTLSGLMAAADRHLYEAKRSGRNCVVIQPDRKLAA